MRVEKRVSRNQPAQSVGDGQMKNRNCASGCILLAAWQTEGSFRLLTLQLRVGAYATKSPKRTGANALILRNAHKLTLKTYEFLGD